MQLPAQTELEISCQLKHARATTRNSFIFLEEGEEEDEEEEEEEEEDEDKLFVFVFSFSLNFRRTLGSF